MKIIKIFKFFLDQIVYLLINLVIFLLAFLFILIGYNPKNTGRESAIYMSIGTSIMAAGIVILLELWKDLSKNKILERINNVILEGGVDNVFSKRDLDKYDCLIKNLTNSLDITGYSLNAFFESYADLIIDKLQKLPSVSIRIIVVDPDSEFSKHRALLEGKSYESVKNSIQRLKQTFGVCESIQLRMIASPLTTMIFRIDDIMFVGPHFYKRPSKSTLTFELNKNGWLFEEYEKEFEKLWRDATEF
jgi:hypothetical protein